MSHHAHEKEFDDGRLREPKRHSDLLGGGHIEGAQLVAVCDTVRERADALARAYGVPAFYDTAQFLAHGDMDEQSYYHQDKWRGTWASDGGVLANQASLGGHRLLFDSARKLYAQSS